MTPPQDEPKAAEPGIAPREPLRQRLGLEQRIDLSLRLGQALRDSSLEDGASLEEAAFELLRRHEAAAEEIRTLREQLAQGRYEREVVTEQLAESEEAMKLRTASESVGWLNSEGPLDKSPTFPTAAEAREAALRVQLEKETCAANTAEADYDSLRSTLIALRDKWQNVAHEWDTGSVARAKSFHTCADALTQAAGLEKP